MNLKNSKNFTRRARLRAQGIRGPVAVVAMAVFATASGVALAQDTTGQQSAATQSTSADPTTSTADPTTSSTTDPTTSSTTDPTTSSTTDPTTTSDQSTTSPSTDPSTDPTLTTTTSDELVLSNRVQQRSINEDNCKETTNGTTTQWAKIDEVDGGDLTRTLTYTDVNSVQIVFTFVFNAGPTPPAYTNATWSSDVPFTGKILVKSANNPAIGTSFYTTDVVNATTGTITTPATNGRGQPQAISHVCLNGTGSTTTSTGTTTTGTTTTHTTTTDTTTTDTTTTDTTTTDTTTTDTTTGTGTTPVAGTTGAGGTAGVVGGGGGGGKGAGKDAGGVAGAAAGEAQAGGGSLPFTGFHAPLMVLVALTMGAVGLALRKRLGESA